MATQNISLNLSPTLEMKTGGLILGNNAATTTAIINTTALAALASTAYDYDTLAAKAIKNAITEGLTFLRENTALLTGTVAQTNEAAFNTIGDNSRDFLSALQSLNAKGLLTGPSGQVNFDALVASRTNIGAVSRGLGILSRANLLTQENFSTLIEGRASHADYVAKVLRYLSKADLLTDANRQTLVVQRENIRSISRGLTILNRAHLLRGSSAQANFNALIAGQANADHIALGLQYLSEANLLTGSSEQTNRNAFVAVREDIGAIYSGLSTLRTSNILTAPNFNALIANRAHTRAVGDGLHILLMRNLLTDPLSAQGYFNALIASEAYANQVAEGLWILGGAGLLTNDRFMQANSNALIAAQANIGDVIARLHLLNGARLLTQANFDRLFILNPDSGQREPLLSPGDQFPNRLTQGVFESFILSQRLSIGISPPERLPDSKCIAEGASK